MTLQDILADLNGNNTKTEGYYTVDQGKAIFDSASIDVPGAKPGALTLTYSGPLDNTNAWQVAESIGSASNGWVRTIGQTDASALFKSQELRDALKLAKGDDTKVEEILYGTDANNVRISNDSLSDSMSERFVLATPGPLVSITPNGVEDRVWGATELNAALRSGATSINGIAYDDLTQLKTDLLSTGPVTQGAIDTADSIVLDYVNAMSVEHTGMLNIAVDAEGRPITDTSGKIAEVGTKEFFDKLGMPGVGTDLAPGQASKERRGHVLTSRLLVQNESMGSDSIDLL